ncbi:hypothetical protein DMUE_1269 [Dictyocoela muelleri]|nr:hypothetical protein DMUE_1269 [Dictyocoela muelleri]
MNILMIKNFMYVNNVLGDVYSVQIDKTVIYKRQLIVSICNIYDEISGWTWIVGIIGDYTGYMVLEILPDRKIPTLTKFISDHMKIGRLVITDKNLSCPQSVKNLFCSHEIVNHNKLLKNRDIIQIISTIYYQN